MTIMCAAGFAEVDDERHRSAMDLWHISLRRLHLVQRGFLKGKEER
jgi:hypothetical protein